MRMLANPVTLLACQFVQSIKHIENDRVSVFQVHGRHRKVRLPLGEPPFDQRLTLVGPQHLFGVEGPIVREQGKHSVVAFGHAELRLVQHPTQCVELGCVVFRYWVFSVGRPRPAWR
jgi:hypothetical protein